MSIMNKENFWSECLSLIKQQITNQAFETWFSDVMIVELTNEEIKLEVPNQYHYEWLEQKYRHLINDILIKVGGNPRVVNYSVSVSNKKIKLFLTFLFLTYLINIILDSEITQKIFNNFLVFLKGYNFARVTNLIPFFYGILLVLFLNVSKN